MFTMIAYDMAKVGAAAALAVTTPVPDAHVTIDGNNIVVPKGMNKVCGLYYAHGTAAVAGTPSLVQLQSPALRRVFQNDYARMHDSNAAVTERDITLFPDSPIPLDENEGLQAWCANTGALALARALIGVWLCDAPAKAISGEVRTIRYTTVTPAVADTWTLGNLTVIQQLPQGTYAVVGARCLSVGDCGLFRLIFTGYDWRPGGVMTMATAVPGIPNPDIEFQRNGYLGEWGRFDWMHLPRLEVCTIAAVANPDLYLDLIKVG